MRKLIVVLVALTLSACAPVVQGFVDLPDWQERSINGIFISVVALVFDYAIGRFPWLSFFSQYREAWALALSSLAIRALENGLPTGSDELSVSAVSLLIAAVLYLLSRTLLMRRDKKNIWIT